MACEITFIVPVYNVKPWLTECVESVSRQAGRWELILVDDGSTDGSGELCERYAEKDKRVRVIRQANAGLSAARNVGLDAASGDWIAFVDGDDWIEPAYAETLRPYLRQNAEVIFFPFRKVRDGRREDGHQFPKEARRFAKDDLERMIQSLIDTETRVREVSAGCATAWSKIYRRAFLNANRLRFDSNAGPHEDIVMNLYAYACAESALFVPVPLYNYRQRRDSISHRYGDYQPAAILEAMKAIETFVSAFRPQYYELYQKRILVCLTRMCMLDYCHRDNPRPYRERKAAFLRRRDSEPFRSALSVKTVRSFSFPKQVCMWLLKFRLFGILNLLLRTGQF